MPAGRIHYPWINQGLGGIRPVCSFNNYLLGRYAISRSTATWWQPVFQQLAVNHLGLDETLLANADDVMFCSVCLDRYLSLRLCHLATSHEKFKSGQCVVR